jgi:hypothetical protein
LSWKQVQKRSTIPLLLRSNLKQKKLFPDL